MLLCCLSAREQKTHQSALQVQQKAEAMLQANHYDMDMIRDCAENVASHWQQLMLKMEDRLKLVNASVAFYKTSEQVRDVAGKDTLYRRGKKPRRYVALLNTG